MLFYHIIKMILHSIFIQGIGKLVAELGKVRKVKVTENSIDIYLTDKPTLADDRIFRWMIYTFLWFCALYLILCLFR